MLLYKRLQMSQVANPEFGAIRSILWPIHRHELKKLLPMLLMLFLICFNYTVLRNMKDSVVVTAAGAEIIPFIKVWVLLPMAIIVTLIFTKLSNVFSQERVFYMMISFFLVLYALFAFVLYPLQHHFEPKASADFLDQVLPFGFKGAIAMYRHWMLTAFYVVCELWSTAIMSVLFWGFANEVTRLNEARRFYGTFGIASNFAAIAAGQSGIYFSQQSGLLSANSFSQAGWEQSVMMLTTIVVISGILTMAIFWWVNRNVLTDPSFDDLHTSKRELKKKGRLSLRESFSYLSNSKYLICIAALVVSYNLVINLVEIVWKDQLRHLYPAPGDYNTYINNLTSIQGVVSTISALFMAKFISRFGWTSTSLVTPITMAITSAGFFGFLFYQDSLSDSMVIIGTTPLAIAVFFGSAQNCLSKAAKYSFFDTTKEMTFIPLGHESKLKGKAAIDGVGSRLGKSGGSLIHQGLLMFFGTLAVSAPYVAAILLAVICVWFTACRALGVQFNELVDSQKKPKEQPIVVSEPIDEQAVVQVAAG